MTRRFGSLASLLSILTACAGASTDGGAREGARRAAPPADASRPLARPGRDAPPFTVRDLDGREVGLAPGRVNLVFFWATWSEPDKKAVPRLQEIFLRHGPSGLALLGLSVDDEPRDVAAFVRTYGGSYPVAWDQERRVAELYAVRCEPTYFVIDRRGGVRFEHCGYREGEAERIEAEVVELLREPAP